jgi:hypothetical protein
VAKPKAPPWARGYNHTHRVIRKQITEMVECGAARCTRCDKRILPGERWHLDHNDERTGYNGAAHAVCNLSAGGAKSAQLRREEEAAEREAERAAGYVPGQVRRWSRLWSATDLPPNLFIGTVSVDEYLRIHGDDSGEAQAPHIW